MLKIIYQLGFHNPPYPGTDLSVIPDFYQYRMESKLTFPLPIGTEVYIYLEDYTIARGDQAEFFEVIGYEHQIYGVGGVQLEEKDFIIILSPRKDASDPDDDLPGNVENPEIFAKLLKSCGWTPWGSM